MDMPVKDIPKDLFDKVLYGSGEEKLYFRYVNEFGQVKENEILFEGVIPNIERRYRETSSDYIREQMEKYMAEQACPKCKGGRLKPERLAVFVGDKTIAEVTKLFCSRSTGVLLNC